MTAVVAMVCAMSSLSGTSVIADAGPVDAAGIHAAAEKAWATHPDVVAGMAALRAAQAAGREATPPPGATSEVGTTALRGAIVSAAQWYWNYGTPYVWSSGWTPCNRYGADCECLNRLAYWDGGWGQLTYTLQGQANTGRYTGSPRQGDLVFWDYDGDGRFGPYDHTGVYTGNGYVLHASTYWGQVAWTTVAVVSAEARGTYYVNIIG
ncbi:MAG TPA: NlpC/P60 family protein [Pseudonocardiaceae bacterium]